MTFLIFLNPAPHPGFQTVCLIFAQRATCAKAA
jgi:hypothetical protein